jgi:hypothetical protein
LWIPETGQAIPLETIRFLATEHTETGGAHGDDAKMRWRIVADLRALMLVLRVLCDQG